MKRKITSLFVFVAMLFTIIPTNIAFAGVKEGELVDKKTPATIYFDYMTWDSSIDSDATPWNDDDIPNNATQAWVIPTAAPEKEDIVPGQQFAIGLRMTDFANINKATNGLFSMSVVFNYNSEWVEMVDADFDEDYTWTRLGKRNSTSLFATTSYNSTYGGYKINSDGSDISGTQIKYAITPKSADVTKYTGQADAYIAVIYFKWKTGINGSNMPDGTKVFTPVTDTADFNIGFGAQGGDGTFEANSGIADLITFNMSNVNFAPAKLTVTYDASSSNSSASFKAPYTTENPTESVKEGSKATIKVKDSSNNEVDPKTLITPPTGYIFDKWVYASDGSNTFAKADTDFTTNTTVSANTTVFATYKQGYSATFHLNTTDETAKFADATTADKVIETGANSPFLASGVTLASKIGADPTRTGYTFEGWYTKDSDGAFKTKYDETKLQTDNATASLDLYARWAQDTDNTDKKYTINFNKNASDAVDASPASATFGDTDKTLKTVIGGLPVPPTRTDYTFKGWYKDTAGTGDAIDADTDLTTLLADSSATSATVYAKWDYSGATDKVTVKFDANGGTATSTLNDVVVALGGNIDHLPASSVLTPPTNKAFGGWYTSSDSGTTLAAEVKDSTDSTPTAITASLAGYNSTDKEITLYAKWVDKVTITYDANGINDVASVITLPSALTDQTPGDTFTVANPTVATDYTLTEWNTKADGTGDSYAPGATKTVPSANTTLYAIWTYSGSDAITVTFDGNDTTTKAATLTPNNGSSDTNKYTITRPLGATITAAQMPGAARTDYTFDHWGTTATEAALASGATQSSITVSDTSGDSSKTMSIYAIWTVPAANQLVVTFNDPSGESTDMPSSVTIANGDSLGALYPTAPTRTGYGFDKWTKNSTSTGSDTVVATTPLTGTAATTGYEITIYAQWQQQYEIEYNSNNLPAAASISMPTDADKYAPTDSFDIKAITGSNPNNNYEITGWNTKANGTGTAYGLTDTGKAISAASSDAVNGKITLYAQWTYSGSDAVTITFDGNGSNTKKGYVPAGQTTTTTQTIVRPSSYTITAAEMPTADRTSYTFDHWGKTATEAKLESGATQSSIAVADIATGGATTAKIYAIWTVTNPSDQITITFNKNAGSDAVTNMPDPATFTIASGDSLGGLFPTATPERDGYGFDKWTNTAATGGTEVDADYTFSSNSDVYAQWTEELTIEFDANNGALPTGTTDNLNSFKIKPGTAISANDVGRQTLPTVERDNYTFEGWGYLDSGALTMVTTASSFTTSKKLYAVWKAKVYVEFETSSFDYDGSSHTPFATVDGSKLFSVHLADSSGTKIEGSGAEDLTSEFEASYFDVTYEKDSTAVTNPTNAGTYDVTAVTINSTGETALKTGGKYLIIEAVDSDNDFEIEAQEVNYKISKNYQYLGAIGDKATMKLEVDGTAPTGLVYDVIDPATAPTNPDIKVTFIDKSDPTNTSKQFINTMPTAFGEYIVKVEAEDDSNYAVGTVKNTPANATVTDADAHLFLVPKTRVVKVNFDGGTSSSYGTADSDGNYTFATVTLTTNTEDTVITSISSIKTTLSTQSPAVALPVEGTNYTAPAGKRAVTSGEKFETKEATTDTTAHPDGFIHTDFKTTTDITASGDPLVIYAKYEAAEWTITFEDTKSGADKEKSLRYTVGAESPISFDNTASGADATKGTQKVEEDNNGTWTDITSSVTDKKVLPEPANEPENAEFYGWTTSQSLATAAYKAASALTEAEKKTVIDKGDYPGNTDADAAARIAATDSSKTVYALYVLSSDATLSGVEFNEYKDSAKGAAATFANGDYTIPTTAITFDKDTEEYTVIITNGNDLYGKFTPSQPGSTITVTKAVNYDKKTAATSDDTVKTAAANEPVTAVSGATDGSKEFAGATTEATTYDDTANGNTYNQFVVTVTAPDGTTKSYKFNVIEYAAPEIKLHYGNSPYGEIMKAANIADADKQAAKNAFNEGNIYKTYIPTAVAGKIRDRNSTPLKFNTNINSYPYTAWVPDMTSISGATADQLAALANPDINMDRNDYAIFIYNETHFVDPGFDATDSLNRPITNVDRKIKVNRMKMKNDNGIYDGNYTEQTIEINNQPSNVLITDITKPYNAGNINDGLIRPDKYTMTYSFNDSITGDTITQNRYVIVLQRRGDTNFSGTINLQDLNKIYQYFNKQTTYFQTSGSTRVITGTARSIYVARCLDVLPTNTVNLQDLNPIYQFFNKYNGLSTSDKSANNNPVEEWYVELPSSL